MRSKSPAVATAGLFSCALEQGRVVQHALPFSRLGGFRGVTLIHDAPEIQLQLAIGGTHLRGLPRRPDRWRSLRLNLVNGSEFERVGDARRDEEPQEDAGPEE